MKGMESVGHGDVSELGVVWSGRHLQGVPPTHDELVALHVEQADGLVHVLSQDAG